MRLNRPAPTSPMAVRVGLTNQQTPSTATTIARIARRARIRDARALRGRGIASELVRGALELIRADGSKVVAGCGFVVDYLRKHPEFADLAR